MLAYRVTSDRKLSSPRICDNYCDSSGTHTNSYRVYLGTCRPAACGSGGSWPPHMSSLGCQETEQPKGRQQVSRDRELGMKKSISVTSTERRRGRPPGPLHSVFHRDRHCAAHGRSCSARRGCLCLQREQPEVRVWQTAGRWHSRESCWSIPTSRGCSQLQLGYLVLRHRYLTKKKRSALHCKDRA